MRHGRKINHLSRKSAHRKSMLSNMATSLILHKRIETTVPKAKALRKYAEPLITKAKQDTTHSRRIVFNYLQSKDAVKELFNEVAQKIMNRPGGYTRILRTGNRLGDNAEMCLIELVDYNQTFVKPDKAAAAKGKRTRRGSKKVGTDKTGMERIDVKPDDTRAAETPEKKTTDKTKSEPKSEKPAVKADKKNEETKGKKE